MPSPIHPSYPEALEQLLPLHPAEIRLLALVREVGHGTLETITVANGVPVLVERLTQKVKLV